MCDQNGFWELSQFLTIASQSPPKCVIKYEVQLETYIFVKFIMEWNTASFDAFPRKPPENCIFEVSVAYYCKIASQNIAFYKNSLKKCIKNVQDDHY